ncbi:hypothetical protein GGQ92_003125, partial [Gracilibacillus halotolerans]|nr:hypothetical protein [Gracilibacillus halotolerans]
MSNFKKNRAKKLRGPFLFAVTSAHLIIYIRCHVFLYNTLD